MPLAATAIIGVVGVSLAGSNGLANTAAHLVGQQSANSAAIPADLHSEACSLITAWRNVSQHLQAAFTGQVPLMWKTNDLKVANRHLGALYSICNYWDTTMLSMRGATTSLEGTKAARIAVHKLQYCFRVLLEVLEGYFSGSMLLDPAGRNHQVLYSRLQDAQDWLNKEYPVVKTEQGLALKSCAWSSTLAGLRVSGGLVAICRPDRAPGMNVTFGSGGTQKKGWILIKHQQGGWPEVLSCPSSIHPTSWHRNATKRSQRAHFADWDLWELMPAFDGEIPGVDYPGKLPLRAGDAVKLSPAYGPVESKLVIAREFWWVLLRCPKLTMRPYQRHHHETTTFVVRKL